MGFEQEALPLGWGVMSGSREASEVMQLSGESHTWSGLGVGGGARQVDPSCVLGAELCCPCCWRTHGEAGKRRRSH